MGGLGMPAGFIQSHFFLIVLEMAPLYCFIGDRPRIPDRRFILEIDVRHEHDKELDARDQLIRQWEIKTIYLSKATLSVYHRLRS